jgi:N-acetylmuramoyl-L-alanine amidase
LRHLFINLSGTQGNWFDHWFNKYWFNKLERGTGWFNLKSSLRRGLWSALFVMVVIGGVLPLPAHARARHSEAWAREHFLAAERLREAVNGKPLGERTRHDYQRVLNAYRAVYYGAPTSTKADPSVVAVAETLVEMGRHFEDDKILHGAVDQYKFLRREYPGSKYRFEALFTIGEIYQDDLNDPEASRAAFQEFLKRYPHNRLSDDARQAIVTQNRQTPAAGSTGKRRIAQRAAIEKKSTDKKTDDEETVSAKNRESERLSKPRELQKNPEKSDDAGSQEESTRRPEPGSPHSSRPARVTGIRHWSTPDYTRVAIDVESDVQFSSQRIATPARIYFDLSDTRLASTLVGKTFDVDDGFLKKVRVAQFAPRRTRVVLELDSFSDYDAFLLSNPSRLIIDIHGKNWHKHLNDMARSSGREGAGPDAKTNSGDVASAKDEGSAVAAKSPASANDEQEDSGDAQSASAASSSPRGSSESGPSSDVAVKRVVDARNEDDTTTPPAEAKQTTKALNKAISKKEKHEEAESDSDSDESKSTLAENKSGIHDLGGSNALSRKLAAAKAPSSDFAAREAMPTGSGDRSLIRALGLKIGKIVIDPGHGGHDTGTIGPNGLEEKDLVLEVGRRLGRLLETRLGAEVVYTRRDDTFIPLETRTAIANQARADLFVSIHANSSHDSAARGVETYYLNFTSSRDALEVAARENAVSETSIYELQDLVKKIALKEKIEESREFAWDVQQSLHSGLAAKAPDIRDRGVKKAPFIVLIGANMPSILAEISFVSNPTDERHLSTSEYRQRIAESLYRGVAKYVNGLSGVKVASKLEKTVGQAAQR